MIVPATAAPAWQDNRHSHSSRPVLRRIRETVDQINPELVISTEFFMDYFHTYTNGALVMDCSGAELDAMKIAMPGYLASCPTMQVPRRPC